jgi:DNA-binding transcriptional LysR family regulator
MIAMQLLVFVTVAEKKSFSRAAEALNLTQPAVSQQIHTLEEHYGVKLFERTPKRVELTRAGETLLPYAKQILDLAAVARDALNDLMDKVTGRLTIGATLTIGEYILPPVLAAYARRFPDVELNVRIANTEEIGEMTLDHSIDVAVVEGRLLHRHLHLTPFLQDEMILLASPHHPLATNASITSDDLSAETFLLREEGSGTRAHAEEVLQALGITPRRIISIGSTQAIKEAVEAGMGFAILSKWCVRKALRDGTLVGLPLNGVRFLRPLSIALRSGRVQTRAARELIHLLQTFDYEPQT